MMETNGCALGLFVNHQSIVLGHCNPCCFMNRREGSDGQFHSRTHLPEARERLLRCPMPESNQRQEPCEKDLPLFIRQTAHLEVHILLFNEHRLRDDVSALVPGRKPDVQVIIRILLAHRHRQVETSEQRLEVFKVSETTEKKRG